MNYNKVVLVTGGAGGIGSNIVKKLAREGYNVILNYNTSEKKAKEIQEELKKEGIDIKLFKSNIIKRQEVKQMIEYVISEFGRIDILINNAGISQIKLFTEITDEDWDKMINTNLTSAFYMTQETVKYMIQKKEGCIINISSVWGMIGASCEVHYSVAKAGLDGMTKSLAKELGPSNIRVNSIAPGIINTKMNDELSLQDKLDIVDEIPLQKIGEPEAITKCIEWIINDDYTTGQVISINGGWCI